MKHKLTSTLVLTLALLTACSTANLTPTVAPLSATNVPTAAAQAPTTAPTTAPTNLPVSTPTSVAAAPTTAPTKSGTAGAPGADDPLYPTLGNGGYDVQQYTIDLAVDVPTNTISATTTIEAKATQDLSAYNLDLSGLDISAVMVNDQSAAFDRAGSELTITPATTIANGSIFTTSVAYGGIPVPINDPGVPFTGIGWLYNQSADAIWVASEPSGAMSWFPSNNTPHDKATYTFRITVAKPYVSAATGILEDTLDNGNTTTTVWRMDDPMASYLAAVYFGKFELVNVDGPNGIPLRYYFPIGTKEKFEPQFAPTGAMMEYFASLLGPYPFDAYGAVVIPTDLHYALENQTLSIFGQDETDEQTVAHELMHQWLGNDLTPASWQDVWLNEGFASYFPILWLEHTNGPDIMKRWTDADYQVLREQKFGPPAVVPIDKLFSGDVYVRGALTLQALRLQVGDDTFFKILKTYYQRFKGGTASTKDFIAVANEVNGADLTEFFNAWLYEQPVPPLPEAKQ